MKYTPLVSIIVPTHNRVNYLLECLNSILRQSYTNFEILIVDDGSTDDTEKQVKTLGDKVLYFKLDKNGDLSYLRNYGIERAKGDYIAFCDDDDVWHNEKLMKQLSYINKYNFICTNAELIDMHGISNAQMYSNEFAKNVELDTLHLFLKNQVITSSVLLKKGSLPRVPFDSAKYRSTAEDYDLWLLLSLTNKILFIKEPLIKYRIHNNLTYSNDNLPMIYLNGIKIIENYKKRVPNLCRKYAEYGIFKLRIEYMKLNSKRRNYLEVFNTFFKLMLSLCNLNLTILLFKRFLFPKEELIQYKNID